MSSPPAYLSIATSELGRGQPVTLAVRGDMASIAREMAGTMLHEIRQAQQERRRPTLIVPVGPVDQFPILAAMLNEAKICCSETMFINMDEYLTDDDRWVPEKH